MAKIGTTAAVITQNALEQYLVINSASTTTEAAFADLDAVNVSVNGTEIVSLSTNAILDRAFGVSNQVGGKSVTTESLPKQMVLPLANGKIEGVNVNISCTTSGGTNYDVYANSSNLGDTNFFWSTSTVNALSNNVFQDFRTLTIPQLAGQAIVSYTNGFSAKFDLDAGKELVALSSSYMSQVNVMEDSIAIYNYDGAIASVQYFNTDGTNAQTVIVNR
jgi:hypothetical protein|tara:strand:- start:1129 stop:1785 length:657 start_codon:yes stop_codon:yes gene_type:complete